MFIKIIIGFVSVLVFQGKKYLMHKNIGLMSDGLIGVQNLVFVLKLS